MNSKEALDKLPELMLSKDITQLKEISECFNIIYKDLELLEILKSILKVDNCDGYISFYTDGYRNNKTILEIKEWLENETML